MALESKPLFHPEVIRQQVRAFNLPERVGDWQPKLQEWANLIASGRADDFKETALLPDFLTDIFCGLLGYTGPAASADTFTFSRERHVEVDGKVADAVLGRFQKRYCIALAIRPTECRLVYSFTSVALGSLSACRRCNTIRIGLRTC
jgi:hypothetical protein